MSIGMGERYIRDIRMVPDRNTTRKRKRLRREIKIAIDIKSEFSCPDLKMIRHDIITSGSVYLVDYRWREPLMSALRRAINLHKEPFSGERVIC